MLSRRLPQLLRSVGGHVRWSSSSVGRISEAIELVSSSNASKTEVLQLHKVLDGLHNDLTFHETMGIIGSLGTVSKAHGPPCSTVVIPMFEKIVDGLQDNAPDMFKNGGPMLRTLCTSLVDLRTFHAPILHELVRLLERRHTIDWKGKEDHVLKDFQAASDVLYAISFLRKSAPDLFHSILDELDEENFQQHYSLIAACKLNWAFLAQGVRRPNSALKVFMRRLFDSLKTKSLPVEYLVEFNQLVESFNDFLGFEDVHALIGETYRKHSRDVKLLTHMGSLSKTQVLTKNVMSLKGFLPICTLISKEMPRELQRFPLNRVPEHMTKRLPDSLGVYAGTIQFLPENHILEPSGEVSGVMKRRFSLMKTVGWHIAMVKLAEVEHLRGEELDEFLIDTFESAVADQRRKDADDSAQVKVDRRRR